MNLLIEKYKLLILGLIIIISGVVVETNVFDRRFGKNQARRFETVLANKISQSNLLLNEIAPLVPDTGDLDILVLDTYTSENRILLNDRGILFAVYEDGKAVFWSGSEANFLPRYSYPESRYKTVNAGHGWYFVDNAQRGSRSIVLMSLIKYEYPYRNAFLEDAFHDDFNLPATVKVSAERKPGYYSIYDREGHYLLSLDAEPVRNSNELQRSLSILLYMAGISIILLFAHFSIQKTENFWRFIIANILFSAFIIAVRAVMYSQRMPYIFYTSPLFDPTYFAFSDLLPSLGDLFINTLVLLLFSIQLSYILRRVQFRLHRFAKWPYTIVAAMIMLYAFGYIMQIIDTLIQNSSIALEPYRILELNFLSIIAYLIIACLFNAYLSVCLSFVRVSRISLTAKEVLFGSGAVSLIGAGLSYAGLVPFGLWIPLVFMVIYAISVYMNYYTIGFSLRLKMPIVIFMSVFIVAFVNQSMQLKKENVKRIYAENLENEQDPVAEMLLSELEVKMLNDRKLMSYISWSATAETHIAPYLQKEYFSGFLSRYDLKTTLCVHTETDKGKLPRGCNVQFDEIINNLGISLPSSHFYFLNNKDGSISYLYALKHPKLARTLYIELSSILGNQELGYPELLLDHAIVENKSFSDFSFAKYKNGKLISQKGSYLYSVTDRHFRKALKQEGKTFNYDHYDHYIFDAPNQITIVVSSPETKFFDRIISFSYTFLFIFSLVIVGEMIKLSREGIRYSQLNFKMKIQAAIVGVLAVSLVLIGVSLIILNRSEYLNAQYAEVNEKINSVMAELEHKLGDKDTLSYGDAELVAQMLSKHSSVFFADIHVYDLHGMLFASSRPEIFKHGLAGEFMNYDAFRALNFQDKVGYMHEENIGKMKFLSSYALLKSNTNKELAYVNLPYFTKQTALSDRLSSLAAALINIFVLMIVISVATAVFVANKVTYPLQLLKNKINSIKLGYKNEVIEWESDDEIGELIADYNRMVIELELSADRMAESERLNAWHQMAKQVAHEIKNPLTPMKLNIQFLKRAWAAKDEKFGLRLEKISDSLIEQIDALANTATEFSNFSQQQVGNMTVFDIAPLLDHAGMLFSETENADIITVFSDNEPLYVRADKEKMLRVFNNLIKNAVQSIPKDRAGEIVLSLKRDKANVLICISDNGCGIPQDMHSRLFEPYFTTKSSGTGLGLGIVKSILDGHGGKIWFETKENVGTRFYVRIPCVEG